MFHMLLRRPVRQVTCPCWASVSLHTQGELQYIVHTRQAGSTLTAQGVVGGQDARTEERRFWEQGVVLQWGAVQAPQGVVLQWGAVQAPHPPPLTARHSVSAAPTPPLSWRDGELIRRVGLV